MRGGMAQGIVGDTHTGPDGAAGEHPPSVTVNAHPRLRRAVPDAAGVLFVIGAAVAVLLPALLHGGALGPYDLLSRYGLTARSGVTVHNSQTTDLIAQMIPWTSLA